MTKWEVTNIELTGDAKRYGMTVAYPVRVIGLNHLEADGPKANPPRFSWQVPERALKDATYDFTLAEIDSVTRKCLAARGIYFTAAPKDKRCGVCGSAGFSYDAVSVDGVRGYRCNACSAIKPEGA